MSVLYGRFGEVSLHLGDCLEAMRGLPDASVDAVVTDPPAGIGFMGKEWDDFRRSRNPADTGRDNQFGRLSAKGPEYGRRDRDRFVEWLAERMSGCLRVAKPGAHALVWAIPRTSHWTALALEDAGWVIEDRIAHLFGTGFPKHKSKLKPATEDWWLATKPGGAKWLNVDQCRVATGDNLNGGAYAKDGTPRHDGTENWRFKRNGDAGEFVAPAGRWPSNVVLTHSALCEPCGTKRVKASNQPGKSNGTIERGVGFGKDATAKERPAVFYTDPADYGVETVPAWRCVEGCPVAEMDRQSGYLHGPGTYVRKTAVDGGYEGRIGKQTVGDLKQAHDNGGGASRFFPTFAWEADDFTAFRSSNCDLCMLLSYRDFGTLSYQDSSPESDECQSAKNAGSSSIPDARDNDVAPPFVRERQPLDAGDSSPDGSNPAPNAGPASRRSPEIIGSTAPDDADTWRGEQIARNASPAVNLCGSCATAIARNLAVSGHDQGRARLHGWDSISDPGRRILSHSLATLAESLGNTDTIPTTASLNLWYGFVQHAIRTSITRDRSEESAGSAPNHRQSSIDIAFPYIYVAKASRADRGEGNTHPTVKPLALMRWLVRLVTRPGELVVDPFSGSGTTLLACLREGRRAVGAETEESSAAIAAGRLAAALAAGVQGSLFDAEAMP